ncbi:valyl-tRNA synthetase [Aspergillus luchuensis]|uniref:Valyl-tRNA synthetase n=1 Tax=Aspergillus kawachii TaxID=1069201 RepID=A0A146FKH2_ASPKA|nr:valyl-tRNA synthetase [Aspergillus luchuensis]
MQVMKPWRPGHDDRGRTPFLKRSWSWKTRRESAGNMTTCHVGRIQEILGAADGPNLLDGD